MSCRMAPQGPGSEFIQQLSRAIDQMDRKLQEMLANVASYKEKEKATEASRRPSLPWMGVAMLSAMFLHQCCERDFIGCFQSALAEREKHASRLDVALSEAVGKLGIVRREVTELQRDAAQAHNDLEAAYRLVKEGEDASLQVHEYANLLEVELEHIQGQLRDRELKVIRWNVAGSELDGVSTWGYSV